VVATLTNGRTLRYEIRAFREYATASKIEHVSSPLRVACPARHPILFSQNGMAGPSNSAV
jgi:hypothetical protein